MSKKVLVTGAAGFLGSNLCKRLVADGFQVIGVDNFYTGSKDNLAELANCNNFSLHTHDIIQPIDIACDWIFNFACPASPPHYQKDPIFTTKTNVLGSLNMLELARKNSARIMQASTSEVYGNPLQHPQTEDYWGNVHTIGPRSCYDEGKRVVESLFFDYKRMYNTDIKVIRIFNTYGPMMDPKDGRVVSNFIMQALQGKPITLYGTGNQTRSFCYVDDLIDGIIAMMHTDASITGPINLGNPDEFTLKELVSELEHVLGRTLPVITMPLPEDDPAKRRPDITRAQQVLGWQPKINLAQGLKKTITYFERFAS
jgi:UDP-glucuronate decarboxylase